MNDLFPVVEKKIATKLPETFALIFDGWDSGDGYYVYMFASFVVNHDVKYELVLFAFLSLEDEENADVDEHINFINYSLEVVFKSGSTAVSIGRG